ncbi:YheU family protein [Venatoribacter cucullus]|uniref:YheU family protein n=1 Tax=Venatoribacter cucullus TaxID=2661630 RepID=UPI001E6438CB|nr:YheU family protein [Venatoribacter cucullus]
MPSDIPDYLDETPQDGVLAIPYQQLSADALDGILEDFVTREGTDYGDYDYSLADKKAHVLAQLQRGDATLLFDPNSLTCHIEMTRTLRRQGWSGEQDE